MNKVVTSEEGVEIHRITRVTTVNWTDQAGQERSTQFVSLQGFHQTASGMKGAQRWYLMFKTCTKRMVNTRRARCLILSQSGEIFGIVGPNGAGKTTTVESVIGLRQPTGGHIRALGLDPHSDRRAPVNGLAFSSSKLKSQNG